MKFIRPIASVFLATLVFVASVGVTINLHLCAGKVQTVSLYVKADPCQDQKSCHGMHGKRNGCCEEETIVIKAKDGNAELKAVTQVIPAYHLMTVILPVLYSVAEADSLILPSEYAHYKPPLPEHDITVFVQSFLI